MSPKVVLATALLASVPARADTIVVASWYGYPFHGRLAASGCVYDMWALTAASRTLPLGTVADVMHNGRTVRVLITDRGPYIKGRDLDLSRAAAERLGMLRAGVAPVDVRVIGTSPLRCRSASRQRAVARTD